MERECERDRTNKALLEKVIWMVCHAAGTYTGGDSPVPPSLVANGIG
jgi:hypothetical protein